MDKTKGPHKQGNSILSKFKAWARLTRIEHSILSSAGVFLGMVMLANAGFSAPMHIWALALFCPVAINLAAFALNDYWDIGADTANKRHDRPLVSGEIPHSAAIWTTILGFGLGIITSLAINEYAFAISAAFTILSIAYNRFLKDLPLLGNLFISLAMAIAFIFGAFASGAGLHQIPQGLWVLSAGAIFAGLGREIIKSVQDMDGDAKARHSKHLPILIGVRPALYFASLCFAAFCASAIALALEPFHWSILSLGLLAIPTLGFFAIAIELFASIPAEERIEKIRSSTLVMLTFVLIAVLMAQF